MSTVTTVHSPRTRGALDQISNILAGSSHATQLSQAFQRAFMESQNSLRTVEVELRKLEASVTSSNTQTSKELAVLKQSNEAMLLLIQGLNERIGKLEQGNLGLQKQVDVLKEKLGIAENEAQQAAAAAAKAQADQQAAARWNAHYHAMAHAQAINNSLFKQSQ